MLTEQEFFDLDQSNMTDPNEIYRQLDAQMMMDFKLEQSPSWLFQNTINPAFKKVLRGSFHSFYLIPYLVFLGETHMRLDTRIQNYLRLRVDLKHPPEDLENEYELLEYLRVTVTELFEQGDTT